MNKGRYVHFPNCFQLTDLVCMLFRGQLYIQVPFLGQLNFIVLQTALRWLAVLAYGMKGGL